jgi:hypothetical protein
LLQGKKRVGNHDQGQVAVEAGPEAAFVIIKAEFPLRVLVESLDDPAYVSQLEEFFQGQGIKPPG